MFKKNIKHKQANIFGFANIVSPKMAKALQDSEEKIIIKSTDELTSSCIQSPNDIEATYRKKNNKQFYEQTINIVETCNPENPINLVTNISVHANNIDDSKELNERIDIIKEKTPELNELHFDGGCGSEDNDLKFDTHAITPVQTAIRGIKPNGVEIEIIQRGDDNYGVSCPNQTVEATVSEFARKLNNRKLKVRGSFKAELFAFAVGISVNFGRIYRYLSLQTQVPVLATS